MKIKKETSNKKLVKEIKKIKKKLINKARKNGLWENFGQEELNKLKDKYEIGYTGEARKNLDTISKFEEWLINVSIEDLK